MKLVLENIMKKIFTPLAVIILVLSACSAQPQLAEVQEVDQMQVMSGEEVFSTPTLQRITSDFLNTDYEDATSIRNQLAYGTLLLVDTDLAVTQDQAKILLPLYQALISLTGDSNSVSDEVNAVQDQILASMTQEQLEKIAELQITNTLLNNFYLEHGLTMPSMDADSTRVPGSGSGMGKNLDQASREATRTAMGNEVGTGEGQGIGQQGRTLLLDEVIVLLTERIGN
jgi:hypothetical protein